MTATIKETRDQLFASAQSYLNLHEDKAGLLSSEHQAIFDSMMAAADQLRDEKPITQRALDKNLPAKLTSSGRPALTFIDGDGRRVRAVASDEPVCESPIQCENAIGKMVCSMITGNWDRNDLGEFAGGMIGNSTESGGILMTPTLSQMFIDLARSESVLMKAGTQTVPMGSATELVIARLTQDPTAYWRQEGVAIPGSVGKFGAVKLTPRVIAMLVPISVELAEDAPNAASAIQNAISAAMGLAIDQAGLNGVSSGVGNWISGVFADAGNSVATVGTPATYTHATQAIGKILTANYPSDALGDLTWLAHPRDWQTYDGLHDTLNQPLNPTYWASKPQRLSTTSISATLGGGTDSQMIIGAFREQVMAVKTQGIQIQVFDQGSAADETGATISAMGQMYKWIRAYARIDFATLRPTWFTKLTGVTNT